MSEQGQGYMESTGTERGPRVHPRSERCNTIAFWLLAVFLLGACAGTGAALSYHSRQLDRTIQLGGFVHDGVVYEVKPRVQK